MAEIQIEQNLPVEEKTQKVERIAWYIFALFLVLALLGLFGDGLMSNARRSTSDNKLTIESQRFERYESPTELVVELSPEATAATTEIGIDNSLLEYLEIENLTPTGQFSRAEGSKTYFTFQTTERQSARININAETKKIGLARGDISVTNGPALQVTQFIYP